MKTRNKILSLFLVVGMMFTQMTMIKAETYDDFSIIPVIPENQIDKNAGYFDLKMEKGMTQTLEIDVQNFGDKPMIATVLLADGSTGNNATKQFSTVVGKDASLKFPLTDFAKLEEEKIRIEPGEFGKIRINMDMKDTEFDGIRLGGITVIADVVEGNESPSSNESGISVKNRIAYTLGLQVRMNDNPTKANLNYLGSKGELVDLDAKFVSNIQNDQPVLMNDVTVEGTIKDAASDKVVAVASRTSGGILPNSNFNVVYDIQDTKLKAGTYTMDLKISNEQGTWEWTDTVEITDEESKDVNEGVIDFKEKTNWFLYGGIAVLVAIIFFLIFIIWKRKKDDEDKNTEKK